MGIAAETARRHIQTWSLHLKGTNRPYRTNWPNRLFRHEPIENAAKIIQSGEMLSRKSSAGLRVVDIAPDEIVNSRVAAHDYVRLYFRPKTPTQYRIEGIAKPEEIYLDRHAPVLVIFVFDSSTILTRQGVQFSDGNMQSTRTNQGDNDEFFGRIPFDRVYHEGAFDKASTEGPEILRCRCAEVLMPSPLPLDGALQAILCRSDAERRTLLHYLGDHAERWASRIRVYRENGLFESRYTYVDAFDATGAGVTFKLHPRRDNAAVRTFIEVKNSAGAVVLRSGPTDLNPATGWKIDKRLPDGTYLAIVELEGSKAYEAPFLIDELPF